MEFLSQTMNRAFITSSVIGLYSELRIAVFWRVDKRINSDGSDRGRVGTCRRHSKFKIFGGNTVF